MCKKTLLTLTVLALASLTAFAASKKGIEMSQDGRIVTFTKSTKSATQTTLSDEGLVKIYGSLATAYPKALYWCCEAYSISGPNFGPYTPEYWEAAAFTPSADHTVTKVEVAVNYGEGYNGVVVGLYADASGVPGKAIKTWFVTGLPTGGTCCTVMEAKDSAGIPVTAGTQYWIVLKTNKKSSNTFAAWNVDDTDELDAVPTAFWCSADKGGSCGNNDAWTASSYVPGPAFAVLGSN
ncbi:MAG TPA: choice-of-anchor R domain-containing protein [Terriglobales bacterium]|nr:choice-of-anchor R domain-containing protein [Terriglobales bacterium]